MIELVLEEGHVENGCLYLKAALEGCAFSTMVRSPKLTACFVSSKSSRRIPMEVVYRRKPKENGLAEIYGKQNIVLDCLFEIGSIPEEFTISFELRYGAMELDCVPICWDSEKNTSGWKIVKETSQRLRITKGDMDTSVNPDLEKKTSGHNPEPILSKINRHFFRFLFQLFSRNKIDSEKVFFLSNRRNDLSGNMQFVYEKLKESPVSIQLLLRDCDMKDFHPFYFLKAAYHSATSRIILIDDSCTFLDFISLKKETSLIQLWHACGAFKTFGYSRLGKSEGPDQRDRNHRFYDYAIVSSQEIAKFYAEGFGIPIGHVVATGIPRTDLFFKSHDKEKIQMEFYQKYPHLNGKRLVLFAPTFRGWDKESAYYPQERFHAGHFLDRVGEEYALLIKHHPYIGGRSSVPSGYEDRILDMTESAEINDLLFVSDIVITDYSSVIFEASLLDIPMLFYAFDLDEYISARDFYYEYEDFVPGKIVSNQKEVEDAVCSQDYEEKKILRFKNRFFEQLDGKSSDRVVSLIRKEMEGGISL